MQSKKAGVKSCQIPLIDYSSPISNKTVRQSLKKYAVL